ncbi:MAG: thioredoxin [Muribaculaceae bacterium]|nr:thioredoxin [Muribaculaceae bacterium]
MNDFNELINSETPTLVDFFATWCGPCKMQAPILEEVKKRVGDKAHIIKVDIDQNQALAAKYNVRSVPTLIMFKNGMAIWREVGVQSAETLIAKIEDHQYTKSDEE